MLCTLTFTHVEKRWAILSKKLMKRDYSKYTELIKEELFNTPPPNQLTWNLIKLKFSGFVECCLVQITCMFSTIHKMRQRMSKREKWQRPRLTTRPRRKSPKRPASWTRLGNQRVRADVNNSTSSNAFYFKLSCKKFVHLMTQTQ